MTNEVIFFTQIGTLVAFVFSVFGLYRILVSAKDATIETLRQQLESSKSRIDDLERRSPSALVEVYARQLELAENMVQKVEGERVAAQARLEKFSQLASAFESSDVIVIEAKKVTTNLQAIGSATAGYAQMLRYQWQSQTLLHELSAARVIAEHLGEELVVTSSDEELKEQIASLLRSLRLRVEDGTAVTDKTEKESLMRLSMSVHAFFQERCITSDDQLTSKGLDILREGARLIRRA